MKTVLYTGGATVADALQQGAHPLRETGAEAFTFWSGQPEAYERAIKDANAPFWFMLQWQDQGEAALPKIEDMVRRVEAMYGNLCVGYSLCDEWDWEMRKAVAQGEIWRTGNAVPERGRMVFEVASRLVAGRGMATANPSIYSPDMARRRNEAVKGIAPAKLTWVNTLFETYDYIVAARDYIKSGADYVTGDYYTRVATGDCSWKSVTSQGYTERIRTVGEWFLEGLRMYGNGKQKLGIGLQFFDQTICGMEAHPTTLEAAAREYNLAVAGMGEAMDMVFAYVWSDGLGDRVDMLRKPSLRGVAKSFFEAIKGGDGGGGGGEPEKIEFRPSSASIGVGESVRVDVIAPDGATFVSLSQSPNIAEIDLDDLNQNRHFMLHAQEAGAGGVMLTTDAGTQARFPYDIRDVIYIDTATADALMGKAVSLRDEADALERQMRAAFYGG